MTVHVSTCPYTDKDSGAQTIGTEVSRYTTAPNLCYIRVTLEPSVDHTPDRAVSFVSLDLGQTHGAASLVSMLSHIHVRSISLDITPLTQLPRDGRGPALPLAPTLSLHIFLGWHNTQVVPNLKPSMGDSTLHSVSVVAWVSEHQGENYFSLNQKPIAQPACPR